MKKVYLCKGDEDGWAIDEDRRLTLRSLEGVVSIVDTPAAADVIHACWWDPLMRLPLADVSGKPVICHMAGDPARVLAEPRFRGAMRRVTHWIAQSRSAEERLRTIGVDVTYVPYAVDLADFDSMSAPDPLVTSASGRIPHGSYVIANFHRDTAGPAFAGSRGLTVPKHVKGPDVFAEILARLHDRGAPVCALLAGPRRHWLRAQLKARGVPFVFVGAETDADDYPANILSRQLLAQLYGLADLCLITSRSEGGPRSVLEAAAARVAVLSTAVGMVPDVLVPECVFRDPVDACERIEADILGGRLSRFNPVHRAVVEVRHTAEANRRIWERTYERITSVTRESPSPRRVPARGAKSVSLWNKFTPPPWGGGNQFMLALKQEAERQGIVCSVNGESGPVGGHIVNSVQFPIELFEGMVEPGSVRVVHRIDGPISMLRATPESLDQDRRCFEFNARYATATVIQSWHTMSRIAALGFTPVNPVLVMNACDPTIFNRSERLRTPGARLRMIATSWSPNPGKGAAIYEWLDRHLDFTKFDVTFVGNCPTTLRNIRVLPPLPSEQLAEALREHDVYMTASRNDPCSNALIEGLACGLPAVYLDSGGHPEIAEFGGLPFTRPDELPNVLGRIRDNYDLYRRLIRVETIEDVCKKYTALLFDDAVYAS